MDEPREIYNGYLGEVVIMRPSELQAMGAEYERQRAEGTLGQFTFRRPSSIQPFEYSPRLAPVTYGPPQPPTATRMTPIASARAQQVRFGEPALLLPGMQIDLKSAAGSNATVSLVLNRRFEVYRGPLNALLQAASQSFRLRQVSGSGGWIKWTKEPYDAAPLLRTMLNTPNASTLLGDVILLTLP